MTRISGHHGPIGGGGFETEGAGGDEPFGPAHSAPRGGHPSRQATGGRDDVMKKLSTGGSKGSARPSTGSSKGSAPASPKNRPSTSGTTRPKTSGGKGAARPAEPKPKTTSVKGKPGSK